MLSLPVVVFLVHLAIYLVNTLGASTVDHLIWILYLKLPSATSKTAQQHTRLKQDLVGVKRELNATSSQDEFAKWAKLRRRHDKITEEYEATNKILASSKVSFDWTIKIVRWLSTNGFKLFLQIYYNRTPMFELPPNWSPYAVEWILSFPRAPLGTVSIQIWGGACATAISLTGEGASFVWTYIERPKAHAVPSSENEREKLETTSKKEL